MLNNSLSLGDKILIGSEGGGRKRPAEELRVLAGL
jgi:hypothetical protein